MFLDTNIAVLKLPTSAPTLIMVKEVEDDSMNDFIRASLLVLPFVVQRTRRSSLPLVS